MILIIDIDPFEVVSNCRRLYWRLLSGSERPLPFYQGFLNTFHQNMGKLFKIVFLLILTYVMGFRVRRGNLVHIKNLRLMGPIKPFKNLLCIHLSPRRTIGRVD